MVQEWEETACSYERQHGKSLWLWKCSLSWLCQCQDPVWDTTMVLQAITFGENWVKGT